MFPHGTGTHPTRQHPRLHRGAGHPPSAHPRGDMHERVEWRGQGLLRLLHREPVPEVPVPGAGLPVRRDVLALRRLVHRHHAADQPLREGLPEGKLPFVVNQSIWFEGETQVRRRHPAGLHQLRALGYQRVRATAPATSPTTTTRRTTGSSSSRRSASSRSASPSPTITSSRRSASGWASATFYTDGKDDRSTGASIYLTPPTCPST